MMLVDFFVHVYKIVFVLDVFEMLGSPRKKALFLGMLSFPLFLCGCQSNQIREPEMYIFRTKGIATLEKDDSLFGGDYARVIEATGCGMPANNATSESEKRYTAIEAAKYRSLAKLAEKLNGVNVNLHTEVRDMVFSSEVIRAHIEGQLEGISLVGSKYNADTGVAQVTLRLGLDSEGKPVEVNYVPLVSWSKEARRIRAESAARIIALGRLLEQIGNTRVGQTVKVQDLIFSSQKAWQEVQGMLEGVEYSEPRWKGERSVTVEAMLKVPREKMEQVDQITDVGKRQ